MRGVTDLFDAIPKVELHCHVEGTVRPTTVIELARKAGRPLPVEDPEELYRWRHAGDARRLRGDPRPPAPGKRSTRVTGRAAA